MRCGLFGYIFYLFYSIAQTQDLCSSGLLDGVGVIISDASIELLTSGADATRSNPISSAVDPNEPEKIALAAKSLELKHVVLTSVTRDDL
ncbi:hypothetical protein MCHI_001818, partial [Candidatus Magnetoovum chiemensis]